MVRREDVVRTAVGVMGMVGVVTWLIGASTGPGDGQAGQDQAPPPQKSGSPQREDDAPMANPSKQAQWRELTPEEERVIVQKGTEAPFTGEYTNTEDEGVYTCRRCGAMLYRSADKFHSGCGWPAFDDEIPGAVTRLPDADGRRTEIVCAHCGGHLGHVFTGEKLTEKNVRHCVNSISMQFIPAAEATYGRAIFAGGCFWGVEYWMAKQPGVVEATSGYTGGHLDNPSYEDLHSRDTGHAEAVQVLFDPVATSFETLAKVFFEIHDPTQIDGQGPDIGPEYRSAVFYTSDEQKAAAERLIAELEAKGLAVATEVVPAGVFWPAEDYHQDYFSERNTTPTCHFRRKVWE